MYWLVWEFRVADDQRAAFEAIYGAGGDWMRLFERAAGYVGSELLRDPADPGRYVTIDRWQTRANFDAFRSRSSDAYGELDRRCADLTQDERLWGALLDARSVPDAAPEALKDSMAAGIKSGPGATSISGITEVPVEEREQMRETERIQDQLRRAFEGEAWHGPALRELLSETTAKQADRRTIPGAHTIWELVLHIGAWDQVVRRRLEGERVTDLPPEQDWPAAPGGDAAWQEAVTALERGQQRLRERVREFPDSRLGDTVPGMNYSFYTMLHGVIQHDLYHAGQIAILKKAQAGGAG
jgi:uncharacterized damage-inducible protein DinB/heme-degrading monooxygenase HmoA